MMYMTKDGKTKRLNPVILPFSFILTDYIIRAMERPSLIRLLIVCPH